MSAEVTKLADRRAAEKSAVVEIVVVANERAARLAGFRSSRRHGDDPTIVAWWPALGAAALHRHADVIRVTFLDDPYDASTRAEREETAIALALLRQRCRGPWLSTLP